MYAKGSSAIARGLWTIGSQGVVSFSHFFIAFVLARYVAEDIFGAFVLVYSISTVSLNICNSLIYIPASVYGSGTPKTVERKYDQAVLASILSITFLVIITLTVISFFTRLDSPLAKASLGFIFPFGFLSVNAGLRKLLIIKGQAKRAFLADTLSLLINITFISLIYFQNKITIQSVYIIFGFSELVGAVTSALFLIPLLGRKAGGNIKDSLSQNWKYGKWTLANQAVSALGGRIPFFALAIITGLESTGAMGVYIQIFGPLNMFYQAVDSYSLPETTRRGLNYDRKKCWAFLKKIYSINGIVPLIYLLVPVFFGRLMLELLYKGKYIISYSCIYLIVAYYAIMYVVRPYSIYFLAMKAPNVVFRASFSKLGTMLILGIPLILLFRVYGAAVLILVGGIVMFLVSYYNHQREHLRGVFAGIDQHAIEL